ncbi:hypothetical protein KM043_004585 [Ampulex compressa]|nr:hypothetical protein KM043_004585 [Ampulex compressa]
MTVLLFYKTVDGDPSRHLDPGRFWTIMELLRHRSSALIPSVTLSLVDLVGPESWSYYGTEIRVPHDGTARVRASEEHGGAEVTLRAVSHDARLPFPISSPVVDASPCTSVPANR